MTGGTRAPRSFYELGGPIENIKDVLGHSIPVITKLLYVDGTEKVQRGAADRLGSCSEHELGLDRGQSGHDRTRAGRGAVQSRREKALVVGRFWLWSQRDSNP